MNNIDRVAEIIADVFRPLMKGYADALGCDLATQLRDAGLLMPDDATTQTEALANGRRDLPQHRTEAGYPNCATCDGGGCPDCTDPA